MLLETVDETFNSKVTVNLLGKEYALKGDIEPEQMVRVSRYVDSRFFELRKKIPNIGVTNLLLLTALNLTDELLRARQEDAMIDQQELDAMDHKAEHLINILEEGIIGEKGFH